MGFSPLRLREARKTVGMTQVQLAEIAGEAESAIQLYEKVGSEPSTTSLRRLAIDLQLPMASFHGTPPASSTADLVRFQRNCDLVRGCLRRRSLRRTLPQGLGFDGSWQADYNLSMDEISQNFHSLVTRFRGIEEPGNDFEEHSRLVVAAKNLLQIRPYREWTAEEIEDFLFVCSLDPDEELVDCLGLEGLWGEERAEGRARLLMLARYSLETGTQECRWQFAQQLGGIGQLDEESEGLLVRFAEDKDEYVRRLAVGSLGQLASPLSEKFAMTLWHRVDPNQQHARMMALAVLQKIGSEHFGQLVIDSQRSG